MAAAPGCQSPRPGDPPVPLAPNHEADSAKPAPPARPARDTFYAAYLAETLAGDPAAAARGYREVVSTESAERRTTVRAALRLAALESRLGDPQTAAELVARAWTLAGNDLALVERTERLRASLAGESLPRRGPPTVDIELANATPQGAAAFAAAETLMQAYYRRLLSPGQLEGLMTTLRSNHNALESVVRAYRDAGAEDPAVMVAAQFRIGALYHDSALAMFKVPPELEPAAASQLRRWLRQRAQGYLQRAQAAYQRCLIEATSTHGGSSERTMVQWRVAAEAGLTAVEELLRLSD